MPTERKRHSKYDPRPIPYGEFGGPFIDPAEVEKIKSQGGLVIELGSFLSDHGMEIIEGHEEILGSIFLRSDSQINFTKTTNGLVFHARNVEHVVSGLSFCNTMELAPHIRGGEEAIVEVLEWLKASSKKQLR